MTVNKITTAPTPSEQINKINEIVDNVNDIINDKQDILTAGTDLEIVQSGDDLVINFTNNSGYTSNVGTVTSVNHIQPDSNGNVGIPIPTPTNMVTTNTIQEITGEKTFKGDKRIKFKQGSSSNKLGFTLYNSSNNEVGGLEYNPTSNILSLNAPKTANTLLGFRYWSGNNIIVPKPSSSGDYYLPLSFKNGATTVTTNSSGVADLSTLMPDVSGKQDVSNLVTTWGQTPSDSKYPSEKLVFDTIGDIETLLNTINSGTTAEPNITIDTTNNTITFKTAYLNEKGGSFPTTQDEYTFTRSTTAYFGIDFIDTTFATYKLIFNGCSFTGAGEIDLYLQYDNGVLTTMDTQYQDSFAKITVIDPSNVSNAPILVSAEEL